MLGHGNVPVTRPPLALEPASRLHLPPTCAHMLPPPPSPACRSAHHAPDPPAQDMAGEINEAMGRSYAIPDDVDESDLMAELDALEADLAVEPAGKEGPSYLQVRSTGCAVMPTSPVRTHTRAGAY